MCIRDRSCCMVDRYSGIYLHPVPVNSQQCVSLFSDRTHTNRVLHRYCDHPVPQRICSSCFPRSRLPGAVPALVLRHQNYLHLPLFPQHTVCGTDDRVQPDAAEKAGIQPHFCSHLLCLCRAGLRSVPAVLSGTFGSAGGCGFCSKILTLAGYLGVDLGLSHFYTILL